jgi:hypothetical protein
VAAARPAALPGWLGLEGAVTVPCLVVGGLALLVDAAALTPVLDLSLLLLLVWAAATSVTVLRRPRRAGAT